MNAKSIDKPNSTGDEAPSISHIFFKYLVTGKRNCRYTNTNLKVNNSGLPFKMCSDFESKCSNVF